MIALLMSLVVMLVPTPSAYDRLGPCGQAVTRAINSARADAGLNPVRVNLGDHWRAYRWSRSMAEAGVLQHSPQPTWAYGENVGFAPDVTTLNVMWLDSPGHRANILDPMAETIGPGCKRSGDWVWGTVIFR